MANFFVVRQPPAHPSGLHFGFFRCPPTTGPSVRSTIRIALLSRHCCLSDEVLAHPVSYPIPYKKDTTLFFQTQPRSYRGTTERFDSTLGAVIFSIPSGYSFHQMQKRIQTLRKKHADDRIRTDTGIPHPGLNRMRFPITPHLPTGRGRIRTCEPEYY